MKNISILFSLVSLFSIQLTNANAQQEKGQLITNIGMAYSPGFNGDMTLFETQIYPAQTHATNDDFHFNCTSIIPNLGFTLDYGLLNKLSVGFASTYQSETVNWAYSGASVFFDKITRINIAARILLHLNIKNSKFDPYIGFRPGCCYWHDEPINNEILVGYYANGTPSYEPRNSNFLVKSNYFIFCFQVLYGMRIYTGNKTAIHLEVGIGQPFLVEGGFTYRLFPESNHSAKTENKSDNIK